MVRSRPLLVFPIYHTPSFRQTVDTLHYGSFQIALTNSVLRHSIVPVLGLTATLIFTGRMLILNTSHIEYSSSTYVYSEFYLNVNTGMLVLRNMVFYWQYCR